MTPPQTLQNLQSEFQNALLLDKHMADAQLSVRGEAQFIVYRVAYRARLRAALRDNYEVLPLVMGDDAFDSLANAYIDANPSHHYSLRWYGHALCDFMVTNDALVDHPAMTDLVRMEWALRNAFDAGPATPLTSAELAAVPASEWEDLQFQLHPSVQLLELHWAVGPIWHALKSGQTEMDPPAALDHHMLVWRLGMNTQWKSLVQIEADFVKGLLAHHTFGQQCESLAARIGEEQAASTAVALLSDLLRAGAICALANTNSRSDF
jgi:hypothetical protein